LQWGAVWDGAFTITKNRIKENAVHKVSVCELSVRQCRGDTVKISGCYTVHDN